MKRASDKDVCRVVESWNVPLVVVRDKSKNIQYTPELSNPLDSHYKVGNNKFDIFKKKEIVVLQYLIVTITFPAFLF